MLKDIALFVVAGVIVYDALTGRVSGRAGSFRRKEHPILFWVMTPILLCAAALLIAVAFYDLYHHAIPK